MGGPEMPAMPEGAVMMGGSSMPAMPEGAVMMEAP
tara:strand:+ start:240 stop:344 length:105 start_codon:yes stop_codon:yes gene_type:complete